MVFGADALSLAGLAWDVKNIDERLALALVQRFDVPDLVARLMVLRGITLDTADEFLHPTLKQNLPSPFTLKDMEKVATRVADAVINNEKIGIMGDYDVDGATSTALLKMFLESCKTQVFTFIPDREDGYGPNLNKMNEFHQEGCSIVITADCGTTSFEVIEHGTSLGMDVIILDHHNAESHLPNAFGVVNPKRMDEDVNHPCHHMAAVGVVFLFVVALKNILRTKGFYDNKEEPNLIQYLDLVAFGTVCDVVKLQGINRLFVKSGLTQLSKLQNKGLAALAELVGMNQIPTTYHLGYVLGPRVNACGRVGKSDIGMRLLSCNDPIEASILAAQLEELNTERREIEAAVLLEAIEQVEQSTNDLPFIVVKGEKWHQGVVGIVAGRLKDRYSVPVFALSIEGNEIKGSSRSIPGIDLGTLVLNALSKGILSRGGGHPMAAGFSLDKDKLDDFVTYLTEVIQPATSQNKNTTVDADAVIDTGAITPDLIQKIDVLAPFGEDNPEPKFVIKDLTVSRATLLKNGHISCTLVGKGGVYLSAIAFRSADTEMGIRLLNAQGHLFHILCTLKLDTWRGRTKIQAQILDAALAL